MRTSPPLCSPFFIPTHITLLFQKSLLVPLVLPPSPLLSNFLTFWSLPLYHKRLQQWFSFSHFTCRINPTSWSQSPLTTSPILTVISWPYHLPRNHIIPSPHYHSLTLNVRKSQDSDTSSRQSPFNFLATLVKCPMTKTIWLHHKLQCINPTTTHIDPF